MPPAPAARPTQTPAPTAALFLTATVTNDANVQRRGRGYGRSRHSDAKEQVTVARGNRGDQTLSGRGCLQRGPVLWPRQC